MLKQRSLIFLCLFAIAAPTFSASRSEDEKVLRHLKEVLWPQAYRTQDVALLRQILDQDFVLITASGKWSSRVMELTELPAYQWPHDSFTYEIKRLDIYHDNTAIIAGEGRAAGEENGEPYCLRYQSSNILVRRGRSWKAVLSHVSGIETQCIDTE